MGSQQRERELRGGSGDLEGGRIESPGIDTGDVDRDGDIDIVINSSPERLVTEEGYFTEIICMKNPSRGAVNGREQWSRKAAALWSTRESF